MARSDAPKSPTPKSPTKMRANEIDTYVGERVRMRRKMLGLSQTDLGQALGLTFQQIQKYERGTNRISASKLYETAGALTVSVGYFFEGFVDAEPAADFVESQSEKAIQGFLTTTDGIELAQAFPRIANSKLRRRMTDLVRTLADQDA